MIKSFLKSSSLILASNIISKVLGVLTLGGLARLLSIQQLGIYNAYINSAAYINQMSDMGFSIPLQRAGAKMHVTGKDDVGNKFGVIIVTSFLINVFIFVIFYFNAAYFGKLLLNEFYETKFFIFLLLIIIFQFFSQLPLTFMMGLGEFKKYALRNLLGNVFILICVIVSSWFYGIQGAIKGYLFSVVINALITWFFIYKIITLHKIKLTCNRYFTTLRSIFKEGFWYYIGNTLIGAFAGLFTISLFSKHIGMEEFAYIRLASSINAIVGIIPSAILPVTLTFVATNDPDVNVRLKSLQIRYIIAFIFMVSFALIFLLNPLITILFGQQYLKGGLIIAFLILTNMFILSYSLFNNFLTADGHLSFIGTVAILTIILHVILCNILIPIYKINGYIIAWALPQFISFLIIIYKELSLNNYAENNKLFKNLAILTLSALFVFVLIKLLISFWLWQCLLFFTLSFFYIILFYKHVMFQDEKTKINSIFERIKNEKK